MKKTTVMVGWFALAALATAEPARSQTADEAAVRRTVEAFAEYAVANNLEAMDKLFAQDSWVRIIEGVGVNEGWIDYRDNHLARELAVFENLAYRYYALQPQVRGDVAWTPFRYELAVDTPGGHVEAEGRGTAILEKRDGAWVIVHLHTSSRRRTEDG